MPDKAEQLKKAKDYALLLLKFRPRSVSEFREKLIKRGCGEEIVDELVADFKKRGLLDDAKFARLWVQERMSLKPMGAFRIKAELAQKGVDESSIACAFDKSFTPEDEYEAAKSLAQRRMRQLRRLNKITAKRRLFDFLGRRGFSYETIAKVVKETI